MNQWCFTLVLLLCTIYSVSSNTPLTRAKDDTDGRLPTNLKPYHYNVELLPYVYDVPPLPFNGNVKIFFEVLTPTSVITVNNDGLTIVDSSVQVGVAADSPGNPAEPIYSSWTHDQTTHFLRVNLGAPLEVGARYVLSLAFTGTLGSPSAGQGLYWDSYQDETGETVYIAATQGESIFNRKAFPCFDEPDLKATFNLTVLRRAPFISFANTPLLYSEPRANNFIADVYDKSPLMSSYQVCIVVGDFVETFSGIANGVFVRIWSRPQMKRYMQMAAEIATDIQVWLETITNQSYPISKMDHIALPSKGGAMENWGLITYGEPSIAYDPETSGVYYRLNIASIVSHELAHQWYGNLVTCKWWNDIWLNEGFATHYNYQPTTVLGWDPDENQQIDPRRGVMQFLDIDCRNNSDPIIKNITTVWQAPSVFSGSTYPKGGAMMRFLLGVLTNNTLNRGLQRYLVAKQYQGAVTDDLWQILTAQAADDGLTNPDGSALDVKERMDAWLNQMGYPLVTVVRNPDGSVTASRTQFLNPRNQVMDTPSYYNYRWHVPLTVVTAQSGATGWDAPPRDWIDIDHIEKEIVGLTVTDSEWVIVNSKARFFYRVHYDDVSRAAIIEQLNVNHNLIDSQTIAGFIDDQFSLARTGYIREIDAMEATRYLSEELKYNPWYPTVKHFTYAERLLERETWFSSYRAYVLGLTVPVFGTVGWEFPEDETPLQQYLRRDMIDLSCANGYVGCVDQALQYYYVARDSPSLNTMNPNILPTVLCSGITTFINDWQLWMNEYSRRQDSQIPDERYSYLFGLACTTYASNLELYLQALIGPVIAPRDKNTAAGYLARNNYGAILLWEYLDANWDSPAFSAKFTTLRTIVEGMYGVNAEAQLSGFIARHPAFNEADNELYIQMILTLRQNNDWFVANSDSIRDWLAAKSFRDSDWLEAHMYRPLPLSAVSHWSTVNQATGEDLP